MWIYIVDQKHLLNNVQKISWNILKKFSNRGSLKFEKFPSLRKVADARVMTPSLFLKFILFLFLNFSSNKLCPWYNKLLTAYMACDEFYLLVWCNVFKVRHSIPCHVIDVSCGKNCRKQLSCGHECTKICHKVIDLYSE